MLTVEQKEFIDADLSGDMVLFAAAGSGKTLCIVERIKSMIQLGVDRNSILCLSYTRAAAQEIINRKAPCRSCTIHSETVRVLTFNGYKIVSAEYILRLIWGDLIAEKNSETVAEIVKFMIECGDKAVKNRYPLTPGKLDDISMKVFKVMQENKISCMEFSPFLYNVLAASGQIKNENFYDFIFIDEAQDINSLTFIACTYLSVKENKGKRGYVVMVGDRRQAIFSFAGGSSNFIDSWSKKAGCRIYNLTKSFRYPEKISKEVNAEFFFDTKTEKPGGIFSYCYDIDEISKEIRYYLNNNKSVCVLASTNSKVKKIKEWLRSEDIKFYGDKPLSKTAGYAEICAIINFFDHGDDYNISEYFSPAEIDMVKRYYAAEKRQRHSFIWRILSAKSLSVNLERIREALDLFFEDREMDIESAGRDLYLDDKGKRVTVTTAHKVKGREFDLVVWADHTSNFYDRNIEERLNLIYVICTRPKEEIILTEIC